MDTVEYVVAILIVCVRLLLIALVVWVVVHELRKSGRTRKK